MNKQSRKRKRKKKKRKNESNKKLNKRQRRKLRKENNESGDNKPKLIQRTSNETKQINLGVRRIRHDADIDSDSDSPIICEHLEVKQTKSPVKKKASKRIGY